MRLALFVVLALMVTGCASPRPSSRSDYVPTATARPLNPATIGDTAQSAGVAVTVHGATFEEGSGDISPTTTENVFVVVDVSIANISISPQMNYNPFYFTVNDDNDKEYMGSLAPFDNVLSRGELAKGENVRGNLIFEVPRSATGLVLAYDPALISDDYRIIRFDLGDPPTD